MLVVGGLQKCVIVGLGTILSLSEDEEDIVFIGVVS